MAEIVKLTNCEVCSEPTKPNYKSYGAVVCASCRVFFRRKVQSTIELCLCDLNCPINAATRTFCQYCRFQKCLAKGMKPNKVKSNKKNLQGVGTENAITLAAEILRLPRANARPFPNVTNVSTSHSSMPFTVEEISLCQTLKQMQLNVWKSNPVPPDVVNGWIYQRQQLSPQMYKAASQNALEKYVAFVSAIEQFKTLPDQDQFVLMASNIGYLSLLRLAFTYQPCYTGQQQISMILYGCPYEEKGFKNAQRLELYQAMPWYTRNHPFQTIVESVSRLELDQLSLLLTMAVLIFNAPNSNLHSETRIKEIQYHFKLSLFRYLQSQMSPVWARWKFDQIESLLHLLMLTDNCVLKQ